VWQAGQHVVISKARDLGSGFLAFDRERSEGNAGLDSAVLPASGRTAFPEIEGEGSDHATVLRLDGRGPASTQTDLNRPGLVRLPARIGIDIHRQDWLSAEGRRSAGA